MSRAAIVSLALLLAACNGTDDKLPDDLSLSEGNAAALNAGEPFVDNGAEEAEAAPVAEPSMANMADEADIPVEAPDTGDADPLAPQANADAPSFDCNAATGIVEHRICQSPPLAQLDREVAAQFQAAMDSADGTTQGQLRAIARRRLAERDRCRFDACVSESYAAYARDIAAVAGSAPPR